MDGWRKPKRKAVEAPAPAPVPPVNTVNAANTLRNGVGTNANTTNADATPSVSNEDLQRLLQTLRTDMDSIKKTFTAQRDPKNRAHDRDVRRPDDTEQRLLQCQDALLSASEKVKLARTERDSLRLRNDELLQSNAEKTADFIRAAGAEKNAVVETNSLRNELQTALRDHGAAVTAPGETAQVTAITATLTARCETAERKVSNLRAELGEARQQLDQTTQKNKQLLDELNVARNMGESDASRRAADVAELARLRREASHSHKAFETQSMKLASALREQLRHDETLARLRHENQEELGWLRKAVEASRVAGETAEHARVDAACQLDAATRDNGVLREETRLQTLRGMEASDRVSSAKEDAKRSLLKLKAVEKKLRQVAGAIAAVDTATGALRHLVQGVDVEEALDVMNDTQDINGFDFGNGNGNLFQTLVPASLAESREGPTRGRRVSFEANASLGNVSDIPASAEAVPVTAPVPTGRRRATRLRGN